MAPPAGKQRIQKVLAAAGVASRRAVEEIIAQGRVQLNGSVVREMPIFVDPAQDEIKVDGKRIKTRKAVAGPKVYFALHKPRGVVCTQSDPDRRRRAVDLVPDIGKRVYCVGRLDKESTGLLILTNDGQLTQHLTHPSHEVEKTYVVEIDGRLNDAEMQRIKQGIYLDGSKTMGAYVKVLKRGKDRSLLEIRLREGRNREIRRMLARVGHKVRKLKRKAIGPVTLRGLKPGSSRPLSVKEVKMLYNAGHDAEEGPAGKGPRRRGRPRGRSGSPGRGPGRGGRGDRREPKSNQDRKDH